MKKQVGLLIAGITLLTALPLAAKAADGDNNTSKTTTAEIELTQDPADKDITLVSVPELNFGPNKNTNNGYSYTAKSELTDIKVHNPGNTSGWDVQVRRTAFKSDTDQLKAEILSFKNGNVAADDHTNASTSPTAHSIDMERPGDNYSIFSAGAKEGIGDFLLKHNKADVTLNIPAGNVAGKYMSTLTWTLSNAPSGTTSTATGK